MSDFGIALFVKASPRPSPGERELKPDKIQVQISLPSYPTTLKLKRFARYDNLGGL